MALTQEQYKQQAEEAQRLGWIASNQGSLAFDAQSVTSTYANSGIPSFLANYIDPRVIDIQIAPTKAAQILGETQKGNWTTVSAQFMTVEPTGEVASYGDFSTNGMASANVNFPTRESYHYQLFTKYGQKELEMYGLANLNWKDQLDKATALALNKFQNTSYFFGISGLKNYGLLNDASLSSALTPTAQWSLVGTAADVIADDIRRIFNKLVLQSKGYIDNSSSMVLALSPSASTTLLKTNSYNVNVMDILKKNYPNLRIETAPEYLSSGGVESVQLIAEGLDGIETATCGFTEKMRAHQLVPHPSGSAWSLKKSQGTWGAIIFRPFLIAQMAGV